MPKAGDAALKALQLDEASAEAHTALADVELVLNRNWSGAEREFKRAIELNPNDSLAHAWYAHYLAAVGRFDESTAEARRSLELDPFSQSSMDFAEWALYLARRYDLVVQQSRKSLELAPEFPWPHFDLGLVYERTGRVSEAIQEFMSQDRLAELQKMYQRSGENGYLRKILAFCREASKQPLKLQGTVFVST